MEPDRIGKYIERVNDRAVKNLQRRAQGGAPVGKQINGLLEQGASTMQNRGESPEAAEDFKALGQKQMELDAAAARTDPKKVKNN
jgi:hypothetical protein